MNKDHFLRFLENWETTYRGLSDTKAFAKTVRDNSAAIDQWLATKNRSMPDDCWVVWRSFLRTIGLTIEEHPLAIQPLEHRVLNAGDVAFQVFLMAKAARMS